MAGYYTDGLVVIFGNHLATTSRDPFEGLLRLLGHEIAHAHQHAVALANGGQSTRDWKTPRKE